MLRAFGVSFQVVRDLDVEFLVRTVQNRHIKIFCICTVYVILVFIKVVTFIIISIIKIPRVFDDVLHDLVLAVCSYEFGFDCLFVLVLPPADLVCFDACLNAVIHIGDDEEVVLLLL